MNGPTMRDRLALALFVGAGNRSSMWGGFPRNSRAMYYRFAEAALFELRVPTDEMLVASEDAVEALRCFSPREQSPSLHAWQAAIDEALKPGATDQ